MENKKKEFYSYFSRNLIKGFIYLLVLIGLLIVFKSLFKTQYDTIEHWVSDDYPLMLFIFLVSEILVGIIPPELFMIWSIDDPINVYTIIIIVMSVLSLGAGWINFGVGKVISTKDFFHRFFDRRLKKYQQRYDQYGAGFIIVAALTPLPFALISLVTGSMDYPIKKYLIYSSFRIVRFVTYGIVIWHLEGVI